MIAIVDYGLGNVQAIVNIYKRLGVPTTLASTPAELRSADKLILPGVGAFDWAMNRLNGSGMRETLDDLAVEQDRPVLGICVGMQMMARGSEEGRLPGLGWFDAHVKRFDSSLSRGTRLPHMGWNEVSPLREDGLFLGFGPDARFYFLHSYHLVPQEASNVLALTEYGAPFASAVSSGTQWGVQFHPEKSHHWGVQLLKNFAEV